MLSVLRASRNLFAAMQGPMGLATGRGQTLIAHLAQLVWEKGLLHAVALDPYGVGAIVDALDEVGISGQDQIVGISQGWKLTCAIKAVERKLADGSLRHSGQGLMSLDGGQCARGAERQRHHHHEAGIRLGQDRSADGGV